MRRGEKGEGGGGGGDKARSAAGQQSAARGLRTVHGGQVAHAQLEHKIRKLERLQLVRQLHAPTAFPARLTPLCPPADSHKAARCRRSVRCRSAAVPRFECPRPLVRAGRTAAQKKGKGLWAALWAAKSVCVSAQGCVGLAGCGTGVAPLSATSAICSLHRHSRNGIHASGSQRAHD